MFDRNSDLKELSKLVCSIDIELQLLKSKINNLDKRNSINEISKINDNLQNNLKNLKNILNTDDIEYLEPVYTDDVEYLGDLTQQIDVINDDLLKTELLDGLVDSIKNDSKNIDELEKLEYLDSTISLNINEINLKVQEADNKKIIELNEKLNKEVKDVNIQLKKRIRYLKLKRNLWVVAIGVLIFVLSASVCLLFFRHKHEEVVFKDFEELQDMVVEQEVYEDIKVPVTPNYDDYYNEALEDNTIDNIDGGLNNNYYNYIKTSVLSINWNELRKKNSSTVGWIKIDNTYVNYPFVQTTDNSYYLTHSFDKSYSHMGWVFMDYRNDSSFNNQNTIIYAHGLVNNTMFGSLRKTFEESWYTNKDNKYVKVYTDKGFLLYEIFSIYKIEPESYYITPSFEEDGEYEEFLNIIKSRSIYDFGVNLTTKDKIITLSTCYNKKYRAVIHAKLLYKSY